MLDPKLLELITTIIIDITIYFTLYLIVSIALNLQYGYTGIPNFGLALSVAGGAYVTGALAGRIARLYYGVGLDLDFMLYNTKITSMINERLAHDPLGGILLFIIIIAISSIINAGIGFLASYPAIRLEAIYLMMVLIAMAEAIRIIGENYYPLVGGTFWVHVPNVFAWMGEFQRIGVTIIFLCIALIVFLMVQLITTSPFGRLIRAVRENETVAKCLGKDIIKVKIVVMVLGSIIASLTGVLYAFYNYAVMATAFQRTDWTFWPWLMVMLGGKGNNVGTLFGVLIFTIVRRIIIIEKHDIQAFIPIEVIWLEMLMMSAFLIIIMVLRPQGLIPEKPTKIRGIRFDKIKKKIIKSRKLTS